MQIHALNKLAMAMIALGFGLVTANAQTSLIATGAVWKYLDTGTDEGMAWRAPGFDDMYWAEGPAQLGYSNNEENDEATLLLYGPDPDNKYITYYFRHHFNVADAASFTNLLLRVLRDDGAIVYLNGTEVFRDNMPAGDITYTNLAVSAVDGDNETVNFHPLAIDPAVLVNGDNVVAVEIHQVSVTSSDISFDLSLTGNYIPVPPVVSIASPTNGATLASALISIVASATDPDGSVASVEFYQGSTLLNTDTTSPFSFTWSGMTIGGYTLRAVAQDLTGLRATSAPVAITLVTPPPTLIAAGSVWRYLVTAAAPSASWTEPGFDDAAWPAGAAQLGYGDGDEVTTIGYGPDANNKYVTTYFRRTFNVENPGLYGSLPFSLTYDDGAVIHVNGVEVTRVNLPAGTVSYSTHALGAADYTSPYAGNLASSVLVAGQNVVAIEMHQGNATSSDLSMNFELLGNLSPSIVLSTPTPNQIFNVPASIALTANAVDTDGVVSRVEYYANGEKIGEATAAPFTFVWTTAGSGVYSLTAVATDNTGGQTTSDPVPITVTDTAPPRVVEVSGSTNQLTVEFSKQVTLLSATNLVNYSINLGVSVLDATFLASETAVLLTTTYIAPGVPHVITISGVRDALGQVVATTNVTFSVVDYQQYNVGGPSPEGSFNVANGTIILNASGTNVAGTRDQFTFMALEVSDDFDIQIRITGLSPTDPWAQAGLMARESTAVGSRYAAVFATPSINGCYFSSRSALNAAATRAGSFPVNYPNMWLRLKRAGTVFTGYVSPDGNLWVQLGAVTLSSAVRPMLVGLAGASAVAGETMTIQFTESKEVTGGTIGTVKLPIEPPGPCSRNTGLAITEIMYHPTNSQLEFIELFNSEPFFHDIGGWRVAGSVDYTFPAGTRVAGGGFVVVARNPAALTAAYPGLSSLAAVYGPWVDANDPLGSTALPDDEGTVRLRNTADAVVLEVVYEGAAPWPLAADGSGHSLVLARPSYGEGNPRAWAASDVLGGSPGTVDGYGFDPIRPVVINEFLAHTDDPVEDFIELYNYSTQAVDLSGAYLSDDRDTNKFRIPDGTVLGPRGFAAFRQSQLGFALSSDGERIYLVNSNQNRVIDVVAFGGQANGVTTGRFPDGAPSFHELISITEGTNNSGLLVRDIVLNEIMYHPITEDDDDEYVELYNKGTNTVDVSFWKLQGAVSFTIPTNTFLPPDGYLVVARNIDQLLAKYGQLNRSNTVGNYGGVLGNGGETVQLAMLDFTAVTNPITQIVTTNAIHIVVDEVTYEDGGRWGDWSDGGGSSLELVDARSDNRLAANWADSDETLKAPWTPIEQTAPLDNAYPAGDTTMNRVQIMLLGRGECLIDDVEIFQTLPTAGSNLVANGGFESGLASWWLGGNHDRSGLNTTDGFGTACLQLRASGGGDNGANRVENAMAATLSGSASVSATLRCQARWLHGHPDLLLRVHGGQIETPGTLYVPADLGSPGLRNSRAADNTGPAIWDVAHHPIVPAASETVVVTARVHDPDGLASVHLRYRVDPTTTFSTVTMLDNGTGADAMANDGIFSASMPGRAASTLVAFYVEAADAHAASATGLFPNDAPTRECNVWFGDDRPSGNQGIYRMWMNAGSISTWSTREKMSNQALDGTFVYGDFRCIYNAGARWRGSPFIRPGYSSPLAGNCAYVWTLPDDDLFLGSDELNLDSMEPTTGSGNQRDATGLREITAFWMAEQLGLAVSHQRQVHIIFNGVASYERGIPAYTDVQQPNSAYMQCWFADESEGEIYKIDDWFEFDNSRTGPARQGNQNGVLTRKLTSIGGQTVHDKGAYRWSWEKKFNRTLNDDYSSFCALVDAVNQSSSSASYVPAIESVMNAEAWLTAICFRHAVGDWDGYGYDRGKNQFIYRPPDGKFHMLLWDLDFSLGCNSGHGPTQNMFQANDGLMGVMYNNTHFRRMYFRAMHRMANGAWLETNYRPLLEARYRAQVINGLNYTSPFVGSGAQGISIPDWINQRRANMLGQIPSANFTVAGADTITATTNAVTFTGTAPVHVKTITVNGAEYPVNWTGVTSWSVQLPVAAGSTALVFRGYDYDGQLLFAATKTVNYSGQVPSPDDYIVINEIMFNPLTPDAEYLELFNTSATTTFDLSGWRFNGVGYVFPEGSFIGPRRYLVLVKDRVAFATAHGATSPIFDQFAGNLQLDGETITLERPVVSSGATNYVAVDKIKYEPVRPWPTGTNDIVTAGSLQLVDTAQDNSRPLNWKTTYVPAAWSEASYTPAVTNEGWIFFSWSGTPNATSGNLRFWLANAGSVWIDQISLVEGTEPEVGVNLVANPGFDAGDLPPWTVRGYATNTTVSADAAHSGGYGVDLIMTGPGGQAGYMTQPITGLTSSQTYTLSFWYHTTMEPALLSFYLTSNFRTGVSNSPVISLQRNVVPASYLPPTLISAAVADATPGAANTGIATLADVPPLWINEVQPVNTTGPRDAANEAEPWIELYNAGTTTVSLAGCYLADNYTNLNQWAFPAGAQLAPGEFKVVFADGEPGETSVDEWHAGFRLQNGIGSVALSRLTTQMEVLDYINYANVRTDESYGAFPDGQPFTKLEFYYATPAGTNDASAPPAQLFINEWMAQNGGFILDPADLDADDWFELYNPGDAVVNLSGYYLSDDPSVIDKFRIPDGTFIPARGYLLVWADEETPQNCPDREVHANFKLGAGGETIQLHSPGLILVDRVDFGPQTNNVSQGRSPDGSANIVFFFTT
ncbi:MAG: lamin tail domain-containing protein, partial [Verrucomicrobia bacterium]|nr:lamin tail domain-containing protein [Verrucomicrobiota bacterium]